MTALVGASVLLITASAIALVTGWVTADESLIWTSIGASVAAGVALALAFFRARQGEAGAVAVRTPQSEPAPEPGPTTVVETATPSEPEVRKEPEPRDAAVAGVPGRKKFHRTDCRYATAKTARSMTRAEAVGSGYEPCAICKP